MMSVEVTTPTSIGVGTTKTQLHGGKDIILPAWVRSITAVEVTIGMDAGPAIKKPVLAAAYLESDDFKISPFEVMANPVGVGSDETIDSTSPMNYGKQVYAVNAAVNGGDSLRVYGKNLVGGGGTYATYMSVSLIISSEPPSHPQKYAKLGTLTAVGGAATDVAGTAYTFTAGHRITELVGTHMVVTPTTAELGMGYIRFESSEFSAPTPAKLLLSPINAALIADGGQTTIHLPEINRIKVDIPVRSPTTIQDYMNHILALTDGNWISGVIFE